MKRAIVLLSLFLLHSLSCNGQVGSDWKPSRLPKLLQLHDFHISPCQKVTQWDIAFVSSQPVIARLTATNLSDPEDVVLATDSIAGQTCHKLWLNGLVPGSRYLLRITLSHGSKTWNWRQDTLVTSALPDRIKRITNPEGRDIRSYSPDFRGFIAVHDIAGTGAVQVLDSKCRVRWYHDFGVPVGTFCITPQNTLVAITNPDEIVEVDIRGNTILHINGKQKGQEWRIHHDLFADTDTSFMAIAFFSRTYSGLDSLGHFLPTEIIYGDGLVRIGRNGKILWKWDCFEHADPLQSPDILKTLSDWNHANSIFTDNDGSILISYKHLDQVWKINPATGEVIWKVGKDGSLSLLDSLTFLRQHTINRYSDGKYYVFDNGREPDRPRSGVRWFELDGAGTRITQTGHVYLPKELFSSRKGSAFPVGNNCLLVCSSDPMKILLVRTDGTILITWDLPFIPLRANVVQPGFLPGIIR